ncbi:MAG: RidA family protein [Gemmatimonadota bacterium]
MIERRTAAFTATLLLALGGCMAGGHPVGPAPQVMIPTPSFINPGTVAGLDGFSQAVKAGSTMYISPQVSLDSAGRIVGEHDIAAQTTQALANLATVLEIGRVTTGDIVQLNVYLVSPSTADYRTVHDLIAAFLPGPQRPAITLLGVQSLPMPGLLVAIGAVSTVRGQFLERQQNRR